jgi:outer membrane biosynthesis protein TonB
MSDQFSNALTQKIVAFVAEQRRIVDDPPIQDKLKAFFKANMQKRLGLQVDEPKPEEKPAEEKPAEPKPEEKPAEEKPAEPKPEEKPAEPKPEEKPAEEKPAPIEDV